MPLSPKTPLLAVASVAALALAGPAAASAADSFTAVTGGDRLVHFTSDTVPGLSEAVSIRGLPGGEHIVAMDAQPGGELLALGRSGTIYGLDAAHHRITRTVAGFGAAIAPAAPATLTVAADGRTARVIAAGRDKTVDLATGAVTADAPAPAGSPVVDLGRDGVLRGVDPATDEVVTLDGAGEHVVGPLGVKTNTPTSVTTAADGATWIATGLPQRPRGVQQSRLLRFDPATGRLRATDAFLPIQLDAIAATGTAPDDTAAPRVTVRVPRQSVKAALQRRGFIALVTTSEPGQTLMSARIGDGYRAFGLGNADHAGTIRVLAYATRARIRTSAGQRIRLHIAVHDYAGHTTLVDRYLRLGR